MYISSGVFHNNRGEIDGDCDKGEVVGDVKDRGGNTQKDSIQNANSAENNHNVQE